MRGRECQRHNCKADRKRLRALIEDNFEVRQKLEEINRAWMHERNRAELLENAPLMAAIESIEQFVKEN